MQNPIVMTYTDARETFAVYADGSISRPAIAMGPSGRWRFVIAKDGERVATIALKFPADGAGRLYAYVQWIGFPMVRGYAGGYGYDKCSAAVNNAVDKARRLLVDNGGESEVFANALEDRGGENWDRKLRDAGFEVWEAV